MAPAFRAFSDALIVNKELKERSSHCPMSKYQRFEEMPVWQEAGRLYQRVLDVIEEPNTPLSATFRNQLERAALCVSNCVAEAFDGPGLTEVPSLLANARGAAAELQSMTAIISERPKVVRLREPLQEIRTAADSCFRQLGAWKYAIENPGQGKRQPQAGQISSQASGGAPSVGRSANGPDRSGPRN